MSSYADVIDEGSNCGFYRTNSLTLGGTVTRTNPPTLLAVLAIVHTCSSIESIRPLTRSLVIDPPSGRFEFKDCCQRRVCPEVPTVATIPDIRPFSKSPRSLSVSLHKIQIQIPPLTASPSSPYHPETVQANPFVQVYGLTKSVPYRLGLSVLNSQQPMCNDRCALSARISCSSCGCAISINVTIGRCR